MKTTEQIINRIRDYVPELKELSFGCEVIDTYLGGKKHRILLEYVSRDKDDYDYWKTLDGENVNATDIEIIGHEPELQDLLLILDGAGHNDTRFQLQLSANILCFVRENKKTNVIYWIDKTLRQNLEENQELTDFLFDLLGVN